MQQRGDASQSRVLEPVIRGGTAYPEENWQCRSLTKVSAVTPGLSPRKTGHQSRAIIDGRIEPEAEVSRSCQVRPRHSSQLK